MKEPERGTVINCIDGRVQVPVIEYIKERYGCAIVDVVTMPGPDLLLSQSAEQNKIGCITEAVGLSRDRNGSRHLAIAGHHDCRANPVTEEVHREQIRGAVSVLNGLLGEEMLVVGLWVDGDGVVFEVQ